MNRKCELVRDLGKERARANYRRDTEIGMQKRTLQLPVPSLPPSLSRTFLPTFTAGLGERDSRKNPVSGTTHLPSFHRLGWVVRLTERTGIGHTDITHPK